MTNNTKGPRWENLLVHLCAISVKAKRVEVAAIEKMVGLAMRIPLKMRLTGRKPLYRNIIRLNPDECF